MKPTKQIFLAVLAIAAVVLCTLPFLVKSSKKIYIYTITDTPNVAEANFISQLNKQGFNIKLNSTTSPQKGAYVLWFAPPEHALKLKDISQAQYDFIYSEAYYPFDWHKVAKQPVMLTPYQNLYEHYMRSNIKSALLDIKEPNAAQRFTKIYNWLQENN